LIPDDLTTIIDVKEIPQTPFGDMIQLFQ